MENYDSTPETMAHIALVQEKLKAFNDNLRERGIIHDASKLASPEKEGFDYATPRLRTLTYGSKEYKESLKELQEVLAHHYANNSHHPEFYGELGVMGMSLLDIVEHFCDCAAAVQRHADGSLERSIQINSERFKYGPVLAAIFKILGKS